MESWYRGNLKGDELVLLSNHGFTNDELAIKFLEHFIKHTKAGPNADWKLLLMDNYGSHCTPEFILLAIRNHIVLVSFLAHLTHCMQPLDVGLF
jgi:DDE superfamily endonuclease